MKSKRKLLTFIFIISFSILACNLSKLMISKEDIRKTVVAEMTAIETSDQVLLEKALLTLAARETNAALQNTQTATSTEGAPAPQTADTVVVITATQDSQQPAPAQEDNSTTVSVSVDTNCRTGPGQQYPIVGAVLVGEIAEVVGKDQFNQNVIVKKP